MPDHAEVIATITRTHGPLTYTARFGAAIPDTDDHVGRRNCPTRP
jgi:hypothetical protein